MEKGGQLVVLARRLKQTVCVIVDISSEDPPVRAAERGRQTELVRRRRLNVSAMLGFISTEQAAGAAQ